ncbi:MAG: hypothetical protein LKJ90_05465 [Faecalibacterium sp.]|nr:hypothetical protein [Faecalibacterium sp.]
MGFDLNSLRVYALGLAHRAVSDISRDYFRQLRNYVDMCAFLCNSDEQKHFFDLAQGLLEKTDNLYYPLIQRTLSTVSEDAICTVGVNLGIDALTCGASELKKNAQNTCQPVHWLTVAPAGDAALDAHVAAGEAHGQYLWILSSPNGATADALKLAAVHPRSDFALILPPEAVTEEAVAHFADIVNVIPMLALSKPEISDAVHAAVQLLQRRKVFYGITAQLDDATMDTAMDSEWLYVLAQHTLFCVYTHPGAAPEKAAQLYKEICVARTTTGSPLLLFDWENDTKNIGRFIHPQAQVEFLTHMQ